jgi:hypothetical protein
MDATAATTVSGCVSSRFDPVGNHTGFTIYNEARWSEVCSLTSISHQISREEFPEAGLILHHPHLFQCPKCSSSLFSLLLPLCFTHTSPIVHLCHRLRALLSLQPGIPLSRSVFSSITCFQLCNISKQAEKQHHPYIGYDPTGHHGIVPTAEQNHARRGATTLPTRHRASIRSLLLLGSSLVRRDARPGLSPPPVQAKWVQNIQNIHRLPQQHSGPIRGHAPIPRPAIFASGHHPRVHIAKVPIQRAPLLAGKLDGPIHDIQKSNRWDPLYHAGVKAPGVRP